MHANLSRHVLAQVLHAVKEQQYRIKSADALLWSNRRMSRLAVELDIHEIERQRLAVYRRRIATVHHESKV